MLGRAELGTLGLGMIVMLLIGARMRRSKGTVPLHLKKYMMELHSYLVKAK